MLLNMRIFGDAWHLINTGHRNRMKYTFYNHHGGEGTNEILSLPLDKISRIINKLDMLMQVSHLQVVGNNCKSDGMDWKGGNREGRLRLSLSLFLIIFSCVLFLFLGVLIPLFSLFSLFLGVLFLFLGAMGGKGVSGHIEIIICWQFGYICHSPKETELAQNVIFGWIFPADYFLCGLFWQYQHILFWGGAFFDSSICDLFW